MTRLVRRVAGADEIAWDPKAGRLDPEALAGMDALIHLGGAGIADRRWRPARKTLLRESRVASTRLLAQALAECSKPPRAFLCASAVGIYGNRPEAVVDEDSDPGTGFLAELAQEWEAACEPAVAAGLRTVKLRLGVVLTPTGGALARMLPVFRLGLGGPLGSGRQAFPWISLPDLLAAIEFCRVTESLAGPVDLTTPRCPSQREFARALGRALGRPALLPAPAPLLRLLLGEMAGMLLEGAGSGPASPSRGLASAGSSRSWRRPSPSCWMDPDARVATGGDGRPRRFQPTTEPPG